MSEVFAFRDTVTGEYYVYESTELYSFMHHFPNYGGAVYARAAQTFIRHREAYESVAELMLEHERKDHGNH